MVTQKHPYGLGAHFVLAVDTVFPWASFPVFNTYDLFAKDSTLNAWWIRFVACIALVWTISSLAALVMSCSCFNTPRRVEFLLRLWFVSSTLGVFIHMFCSSMNAQWVLVIFCFILRLPYFYMIMVYWTDLRKLSKSEMLGSGNSTI